MKEKASGPRPTQGTQHGAAGWHGRQQHIPQLIKEKSGASKPRSAAVETRAGDAG